MTSGPSLAGSVLRWAAILGNRSVVESRLLGLGGSSSRMIRRISSNAASLQPLLLERRRAGQQFVQEHAQGVDVAAGVDVLAR